MGSITMQWGGAVVLAAVFSINAVPAVGADAAVAAVAPKGPPPALVNAWLRKHSPAASAWDLGGQFRLRYELKEDAGSFPNRDFLEGLDNSNDYLLIKTKVHLGWTPESWVSAYVEGRDSHAIGDRRPITETDSFDLHQAWLRLGDPRAAFPITFKVGRQEMLYGEERFIGIADWSNVGRSFDAAKLRWERGAYWVDLFAGRVVLPRDEHFNRANDYDWFSGIYASVGEVIPFQTTEVFLLSRNIGVGSADALAPGLGGPGPRDVYTYGTRWKSHATRLGAWDYVVEVAGQTGSIAEGGRRADLAAYTVGATLGYTWKTTATTPRVSVGYDGGSGDSDPNDGRHETFDMLFGTNHKLYGLMDLFGPRNMHLPRVGASFKPTRDLTVSVEWIGHWMVDTEDYLYPESAGARTQNGYGRHPGFNGYVGQEVDVLAAWKVSNWGVFQAGYGHFFTGDYLRQTAESVSRGVESADWVYLQAAFNF